MTSLRSPKSSPTSRATVSKNVSDLQPRANYGRLQGSMVDMVWSYSDLKIVLCVVQGQVHLEEDYRRFSQDSDAFSSEDFSLS